MTAERDRQQRAARGQSARSRSARVTAVYGRWPATVQDGRVVVLDGTDRDGVGQDAALVELLGADRLDGGGPRR